MIVSNIVFVKFSRHVGGFSSHNGCYKTNKCRRNVTLRTALIQPSTTGIWRDFAQPQCSDAGTLLHQVRTVHVACWLKFINPIFFNNALTKARGYSLVRHATSLHIKAPGTRLQGLSVTLKDLAETAKYIKVEETPFSDLNMRSCRIGTCIINTWTRRVCTVNDSGGNIWYKRLKKCRPVRHEYDILPFGSLY